MKQSSLRFVKWALQALIAVAALYVVVMIYIGGQPILGTVVLGACALAAYIFSSQKTYVGRYLFPGLVGIAVFVVLPLVYTVWIGFTNYSSSNILTLERATSVLLSTTIRKEGETYLFTLHPEADQFRLVLRKEELESDEAGIFDDEPAPEEAADAGPVDGATAVDAGSETTTDAATDSAAAPTAPAAAEPTAYISKPFRLSGAAIVLEANVSDSAAAAKLAPALELRQVIDQQTALGKVEVTIAGNIKLVNTGLRTFAAELPMYVRGADGSLVDQQTGTVLHPSLEDGFYQTKETNADGTPVQRVTPGFRVFVGGANFARIFTDPNFRGPFFKIFLWTVTFAGLTVLLTLIVGAVLAELFNWEGLRFRPMYRVILFIPYAVPSFISILVFKGLFNQNFGEINLILSGLFGIRPTWFSDPTLAKVMILIVNTWLGYPYTMLLCMGLRQSISNDLYEASAIAGAGPFTNYFRITWPLIRKPLMPLLISSFAFNFNNFVLISLLTGGLPDFLGTKVPAGTTDILVSYTYRIAFQDSGKNYALAAAISTVIFILVAALSVANLKLTKVNQGDQR
jgi:maltose/maltodextrin transport system permease protein